jgi:hypothetical protein
MLSLSTHLYHRFDSEIWRFHDPRNREIEVPTKEHHRKKINRPIILPYLRREKCLLVLQYGVLAFVQYRVLVVLQYRVLVFVQYQVLTFTSMFEREADVFSRVCTKSF